MALSEALVKCLLLLLVALGVSILCPSGSPSVITHSTRGGRPTAS